MYTHIGTSLHRCIGVYLQGVIILCMPSYNLLCAVTSSPFLFQIFPSYLPPRPYPDFPSRPKMSCRSGFSNWRYAVWDHTLHLEVGSLTFFDLVPPFSVTLTHERHQPLFHSSSHSLVPSSSFLSSLHFYKLEVMSEGLMDSS